jgi:hypothetical protein
MIPPSAIGMESVARYDRFRMTNIEGCRTTWFLGLLENAQMQGIRDPKERGELSIVRRSDEGRG